MPQVQIQSWHGLQSNQQLKFNIRTDVKFQFIHCSTDLCSPPHSLTTFCWNTQLNDVEVKDCGGGDDKSWGLWHEHRGSLRRYTLQGRSCTTKLSWLKDLRELQQRSGQPTNSKCFIVKCVCVFCFFKWLNWKLSDWPFRCDLTGPPAFETLLSDCITKTGETIKLTCKVTGSPKPVVSWLKGLKLRKML